MKNAFSIKNKILIMLSILPLLSVASVVFMASATFKDDKITYVYNAVLSSVQAKSSSASVQLKSFIQNLRALTINYDPENKKLSANGLRFLQSEKHVKAFFDHNRDGEKFHLEFKSMEEVEEEYLADEVEELSQILPIAWSKKIVIQPLESRPYHLIVSARVGETSRINSVILESPDFYSLFNESAQENAFLYNKDTGFLIGSAEPKDLSGYLAREVFSKDLFERTSEAVIDLSLIHI